MSELPTESSSGALPPQKESFVEENNIHPVFFAIGVLFVIFVLYQIVAGTITVLIAGSKITPQSVAAHRSLTMAGQILFIFLPTMLFARLLSVRGGDVFPWRMPKIRESVFALLGLVFMQQIFQIYLFFQDRLPLPKDLEKLLEPIKQMMEEMFRVLVSVESSWELAFVLLVVAFIPAIAEEMLFRGLIQTSFQRIMTPLRAALVSGVIFGGFHFNPFAIVPLMALGCYFGFLRMRSKSMFLPMTAHFVNNAIAVVVAYFNMEDEMIFGAEKGSDPNIPAILSELFLFVILFLVAFVGYVRATRNVNEADHGT